MAANPDWTSLPPELLHLVTTKLSPVPDFIYFRAVCKPWRSSTPIPQKGPWILYIPPTPSMSSHLRFLSLSSDSSDKVFTIPLPCQIEGKGWLGPAYDGYLLVPQYDGIGMSLFNPLTDHQVLLPYLDDCWFPQSFMHRSGDFVIVKKLFDDSLRIALFRIGDKKWTYIAGHDEWDDRCICGNGMYFSHSQRSGDTRIVEIATGNLISVVPSPLENLMESVWLVESSGDILMVVLFYALMTRPRFQIYKLMEGSDNTNHSSRWVQIDTIGDSVLFIAEETGVSLKASQFHGLKHNCIYFRCYLGYGGYTYRYNIEDGGIEKINCTFYDWHVFVPNLHNLDGSSSE